MEKLSQRENIFLDYTLQRSFTNPSSSSRTPSRNSDVDFHDVFGGPPRRRSSVHEARHSFTETLDSFALKGDGEALAVHSSPWSNEKPVFGEESGFGRRRYSDDFFDDIFKGDESVNSPTRKHDRDVFSPTPVLSPARPLPPSSEPFGNSSLPAQLSLPTRLAIGTDLPPFGSSVPSPHKQRDSGSNGSHANSPRFTLSRFSSISSQENTNAFREEGNQERNDLLPDIDIEDQANPCPDIVETNSAAPSESSSSQSAYKDVGYDTIKHTTREKVEPQSLPEDVGNEKAEKKKSFPTEDQKHEMRTFSSFIFKSKSEQGEKERTREHSKEESMVKSDKKSSIISRLSGRSKKQDKEPINSKDEKLSSISSDMDSAQNIGRKKVGGKVSEFVKIFNQEPASKLGDVVDLENQSSRRKQRDTAKAQTEATVDKICTDEKPKLNNNTDASNQVDDIPKQSVDHSARKTASSISRSTSSKQDSSVSNTVPDGPKYTIADLEEPFQDNFLIKELPQDYDDPTEPNNGLDEFQDIDAKIRQWSNGKEGNIRSLLSTLQYILWPESGWKPVPLVDIIEGSAVKRSYQKALLYLHPDKLQQKGASSNQKYTAAKVFDMLQEAWTHFNTIGGL